MRDDGCYIECDYIAITQEQEDLLFAECERKRQRNNIAASQMMI
ncbi:hypothetical protein [Clostridium sp. CS001]|nr:hypothetical protein [Clostridium sp. CS001]